ncbi:MAG TPA: PAS domain-containing protein, partial [Gammaproteobacteria bacterium]
MAAVAEKPFKVRRDFLTADADFGWRVLGLLNLFRLALAAMLLLGFIVVDEPRLVGAVHPRLAWQALIAMLAAGCVEMWCLYKRRPDVERQAPFVFAADLVLVVTLIHASGGMSNGLGGLLVVSVGAVALLVPARLAFFFAALTSLALLGEQTYSHLTGVTDLDQYVAAALLGIVLFLITAVVQIVRRRIVETEALAEQRGVDLKNLVELNDYIIQHLRESIVVVDGDDRVRLINEAALKHLGASGRTEGIPLRSLSFELAERLLAWRTREQPERA